MSEKYSVRHSRQKLKVNRPGSTRRGLVSVERSEWAGHLTETKGMECRVVPMTARLRACVQKNRHLIGARLLYTDRGQQVTAKVLQKWLARAQRRAQLRVAGGLHQLRHTFCSHLAMRGAPALSIQKLAGHKNMQTTLRYMHLAPGETDRAIRLLEGAETAVGTAGGDPEGAHRGPQRSRKWRHRGDAHQRGGVSQTS